MKIRRIAAVVALATMPSLLPAQSVSPGCAGAIAQDACQKAVDVFTLLAPQLGAVIAGGNAIPGQTGPIGGFGHFSLGLRANGIRADVPDARQLTVQRGAAERGTIQTTGEWVGLPVLDADIGLFRGFPIGASFVGGLDLLLSGTWLPSFDTDGVSFDLPDGRMRVGMGARLGILRESFEFPGVDLTLFRSGIPTANVTAWTDRGDTLRVIDARVRVDSWRLVAGKSFLAVALAAGAGQDRHQSSASVAAGVLGPDGVVLRVEPTEMQQRLTRTNVFANVALNAAPLRLVGEIGRAWGGTLDTYNTFDGVRADDARLYGSVGLRIGF
ncbi:MAG: hypothetical protein ACYC2G_13480 [Gemmatimonadaceae bacterium]